MKRKAFTLLETIVVLAIIAFFFAVSVPLFSKFAEKSKLETAARNIVSTLRTARSYAINNSATYGVVFDTAPTPHQYYIQDEGANVIDKKYRLPTQIRFNSVGFTGGAASFLSTGELNETNPDTSVIIEDSDTTRTITVERTTGRVKIE